MSGQREKWVSSTQVNVRTGPNTNSSEQPEKVLSSLEDLSTHFKVSEPFIDRVMEHHMNRMHKNQAKSTSCNSALISWLV